MGQVWDGVTTSWSDVVLVPLSALLMVVAIVVVVRVVGLRSFSKMSSFDFAVTVSVGSILGSVVASATTVLDGVLAVASLLLVQAVISFVRSRRSGFESTVDNTPILLVDGPDWLADNMRIARVSEADIRAKLREANVTDMGRVRAVVLETTGDISVLHGDAPLDPSLLQGVRGARRIGPVDP